jgi:hypothetical protein
MTTAKPSPAKRFVTAAPCAGHDRNSHDGLSLITGQGKIFRAPASRARRWKSSSRGTLLFDHLLPQKNVVERFAIHG